MKDIIGIVKLIFKTPLLIGLLGASLLGGILGAIIGNIFLK